MTVPKNKPRGRQAKKNEKPAETPPVAAADTAPPEKKPAAPTASAGPTPSDPFKANLPQKRPRPGKQGTPAPAGAKVEADEEGFAGGLDAAKWEKDEGLFS